MSHTAEEARHRGRFQKVGAATVAVLAALLAISAVYGRRSATHMLLYQEQLVDTVNLIESNSIKEEVGETTLTVLRVLVTDQDTAAAAREQTADLERRIVEEYRPNQAALKTEAEKLEIKQHHVERAYESFELAETAVQMAIVFASIALLAFSTRILWFGVAIGSLALILVLDGFFTFLPFF